MIKASCLCGGVRIEISGDKLEKQPEACHCTMCRKETGHFLVAVNVNRKDLTVRGEDKVKWYRSSEKVERGFCSVCGSVLFWRPDIPGYEYTAVAMGLFDQPTGARIRKHTFVKEKGDYYEINDDAPQAQEF